MAKRLPLDQEVGRASREPSRRTVSRMRQRRMADGGPKIIWYVSREGKLALAWLTGTFALPGCDFAAGPYSTTMVSHRTVDLPARSTTDALSR
jgi:hypothetical protein